MTNKNEIQNPLIQNVVSLLVKLHFAGENL